MWFLEAFQWSLFVLITWIYLSAAHARAASLISLLENFVEDLLEMGRTSVGYLHTLIEAFDEEYSLKRYTSLAAKLRGPFALECNFGK